MSWVVDDSTETRVVIKDGRRAIAYLAIGQDQHASLLASAPELLVALRECTDRFERACIHSGSDPQYAALAVEKYRAAIAKAGRTA